MKLKTIFLTTSFLTGLAIFGCGNKTEDTQTVENIKSEATAQKAEQLADIPKDPANGWITGQVSYLGKPKAPQMLLVVKDRQVCGKHEIFDESLQVGNDGGLANAVISIVGMESASGAEMPARESILDQQGCIYKPHVVLAPAKQEIQILNNDGVLHNIHTFSSVNQPVNISQPAMRKRMTMNFEKPEVFPVRCDVHGWMAAWIVVMAHPYYALTDGDGNFVLKNVPPGDYKIKSWHETLGEQTVEIRVEAGQESKVAFKYPAAT